MTLTATWRDSGYEPQCAPDPRYPDGIDIDLADGKEPSCQTALPYPAIRIGTHRVYGSRCGLGVAITTAGRADDPRSVRVACKS